jgi:hypothetical protein
MFVGAEARHRPSGERASRGGIEHPQAVTVIVERIAEREHELLGGEPVVP